MEKGEAQIARKHQRQKTEPAEVQKLAEAKVVQVKAEAEKRMAEKLAEMKERFMKSEERLLTQQQKRKKDGEFKKQQQQIHHGILGENVERYSLFSPADKRKKTPTRSN